MPRFLVVDDDFASVTGLTFLLRSDGHDVTSCFAEADAVKESGHEAFDVVLTALNMSQTDGRAVVRAARKQQPNACLIVVAARADGIRHELQKAGACFIAEKPVDYDAVVETIAECRAHGCCRVSSKKGQADLTQRQVLYKDR
jgi:CheY-like chemotaxis protein